MKPIIRLFFRTLRVALGPVMLLKERLTQPKGVVRPLAQQQAVDAACRQLALGQIDVVLHYSREGAQRFLRLAQEAGVGGQALAVRHLCLSGEVAGAFEGGACVLIANHPNEEFLLNLLDDCPSGR